MPEVGEEFFWCGTRFRREPGDIENAMFPVIYVSTDQRGLMQVDEVENFRVVKYCETCGHELSERRR
jgi:hypothetical protein